MTPEILNVLFAAVGAFLTWLAARRGIIKPAVPVVPAIVGPAPIVIPGVPAAPAVPGADGMMQLFMARLMELYRKEMEAKANELAARVLPPAEVSAATAPLTRP